ncbi:MAG: D-sedoheptulose 7-phosphate isomerase [Rhodospirillales bacterium]|nr:D-sedoheptulose 7-phosphate isomerase [Alphaproteobacteria bacterium]MCB1838991.1 D-sedoheptulose 7-phosphate isomerase [Alphaproteobacteria bacterium]MCB9976497.1 D-sedoheptulose 7-phosphate isomerase [Rhodospirillales bacterium]
MSERDSHLAVAEKTFETLKEDFALMIDACARSLSAGGKILFFGNGGSAADAQHLATELTVRFVKNRAPLPALALTTDTSSLTAIGNDYGFDHLFSRQVDALGQAGDIAIGISTSGNSPNVLNGLRAARSKNIITVGLAGRNGGKMPEFCDILLTVPAEETARIQEMHITLGHMLCGALENKLGLV